MLQEAVSLLDESLEEEKITDDALTKLAKAAVNQVDRPQSDLCGECAPVGRPESV